MRRSGLAAAFLVAVEDMYAAFGLSDIDFIIDQLNPGVKWTAHFDPIVPWAGDFSTKVKVPLFFKAISDNVEVLGFEPTEYVSCGETVVSLGTFTCRALSTGKATTTKWIFVWKFSGGKVDSCEQFHDGALVDIFRP